MNLISQEQMQKTADRVKRLIIYDFEGKDETFLTQPDESVVLFPASPMVKSCIGCFQCWTRTPGKCIIEDRCGTVLGFMPRVEELALVSPLVYGGFSPEVKAVLDRSIGYLLPYFRMVGHEMHH